MVHDSGSATAPAGRRFQGDDLQQNTAAVEQNTEQAQEYLRSLKALAEAVEAANRQQCREKRNERIGLCRPRPR
jgi:hypothetical protein